MALAIVVGLLLASMGAIGATPPAIVLCEGSVSDGAAQTWSIPSVGEPAAVISLLKQPSSCISMSKEGAGGKTCDPNGNGCLTIGYALIVPPRADSLIRTCFLLHHLLGAPRLPFLPGDWTQQVSPSSHLTVSARRSLPRLCPRSRIRRSCASAPKWQMVQASQAGAVNLVTTVASKKICVDDFLTAGVLQAYPCVDSPNQAFRFNDTLHTLQDNWWGGSGVMSLSNTPNCKPDGPPVSPFCPQYHPIHEKNVYDPSGPLLDNQGLWHTWEDDGGWSASHLTTAAVILHPLRGTLGSVVVRGTVPCTSSA